MRINSDKFDAVNAALDLVQTRARVRKLTALDIARILVRVNCKLGIPKKALKGTCIKYTGAEHFLLSDSAKIAVLDNASRL